MANKAAVQKRIHFSL